MDTIDLGAGLRVLSFDRYDDARGWLSEIYNEEAFAEAGVRVRFLQDNVSLTPQAGVVRGLHFQTPPHAQGKLFRVVRGAAFNVALDLRSERFGTVHTRVMRPGEWIFMPEGFAHGFQSLVADTEIHYRVSKGRVPEALGSVDWADPELDVRWPIEPRRDLRSIRDERSRPVASLRGVF